MNHDLSDDEGYRGSSLHEDFDEENGYGDVNPYASKNFIGYN